MRTIQDIYDQYQIMPPLQLHQLRVAAVAKQICLAATDTIDSAGVVYACLIHDMGNLLKFDLTKSPEPLDPTAIASWERVKAEMTAKYGPDEHVATARIAEELAAPGFVQQYLKLIGFANISRALATGSREQQICCYADQRVAPSGVVTITERLEDGRRRYAGHPDKVLSPSHLANLTGDLEALERTVFSRSTIAPEDITNESIGPSLETLRQTQV